MPVYAVRFCYRPPNAASQSPEKTGCHFIEAESPRSAEDALKNRVPALYAIEAEPIPYQIYTDDGEPLKRLADLYEP